VLFRKRGGDAGFFRDFWQARGIFFFLAALHVIVLQNMVAPMPGQDVEGLEGRLSTFNTSVQLQNVPYMLAPLVQGSLPAPEAVAA
jgi:hypothetical protein